MVARLAATTTTSRPSRRLAPPGDASPSMAVFFSMAKAPVLRTRPSGAAKVRARSAALPPSEPQKLVTNARGEYLALTSRQPVSIHPSSALFSRRAPCVLFNELLFTTRLYMREVTQIEREWLPELAPQYFGQG